MTTTEKKWQPQWLNHTSRACIHPIYHHLHSSWIKNELYYKYTWMTQIMLQKHWPSREKTCFTIYKFVLSLSKWQRSQTWQADTAQHLTCTNSYRCQLDKWGFINDTVNIIQFPTASSKMTSSCTSNLLSQLAIRKEKSQCFSSVSNNTPQNSTFAIFHLHTISHI